MTTLQAVMIIAILGRYLSEQLLSYLNKQTVQKRKSSLPPEVSKFMDEQTWEKCSEYTIAKSNFSNVSNFVSLTILISGLLLLLPWFFKELIGQGSLGVWSVSLWVSVALFIFQIPDLLLDLYRQLRLEEKFGFNKYTFKLWVSDKIKELILGISLLVLIIALIQFIYDKMIKLTEDFWWIFAFLIIFIFQLIMMILWPRIILPLFNKLTPLNDENLKNKLHGLAKKTGFTTREIQVMDGSKRSGHSNAFFTGFGKFRKIVLYDTLIEQMEEDEVVAVVAHEIGHYKLGHIPKRLGISLLFGLFYFYCIHLVLHTRWFSDELLIPEQLTGMIGPVLLVFILFGGCFTYWFSPISNTLSRRHEFEADGYAVSATDGARFLSSALEKLSVENLNYPLPHPWMSYFHHSHPSLPERVASLSK